MVPSSKKRNFLAGPVSYSWALPRHKKDPFLANYCGGNRERQKGSLAFNCDLAPTKAKKPISRKRAVGFRRCVRYEAEKSKSKEKVERGSRKQPLLLTWRKKHYVPLILGIPQGKNEAFP